MISGIFRGKPKDVIVANARLKLPKWPEGFGGDKSITQKGTVHLVFNNSFSWVTPKVITYKTQIAAGVPDF